ncbi:MAG: hypothetical protein KDB82_00360 [Planctomycetes bacterium]|nr:hypothetical protein [Planctomycetota bacterium]
MLRLLIIALLLCAGPLSATTFTVTNANDSGAGSLRDAIDQAEAASGADVIDFNIGAATPIELSTMDLTKGYGKTAIVIDSEIDIDATSSAFAVTITRAAAAPEMRLFGIGPNAIVTMTGLTLDGGIARGGDGGAGPSALFIGGGGAGMGGAIYLYQGELTLQNCTLSNNQAIGGSGNSASGPATANGGGGGGSSSFDGGNFTGTTSNSGAGGGGIGGDAPDSVGGPGGANQNGAQAAGGTSGTLGGGGGGGTTTAHGTDVSAGGFGGGGGGGDATLQTMGKGGFGAGGGANGSGRGGNGGFGGGGGAGGIADSVSAYAGGNGQSSYPRKGGGGAGMGGAVFNHAGLLAIVDCTFDSNTATGGTGGNAGSGLGGAIFARSGATYVQGTTAFTGNSATTSGGDGFVVADGVTTVLDPGVHTFGTAEINGGQIVLPGTTIPAPNISAPASAALDAGGTVTLSAANSNALTIARAMTSPDVLLVALQLPGGTIQLASLVAVSIVGGANGTGSIVLIGLEAQLNNSLEGLTLTMPAGQSGQLQVTATDPGPAGLGIPGTAVESISLLAASGGGGGGGDDSSCSSGETGSGLLILLLGTLAAFSLPRMLRSRSGG